MSYSLIWMPEVLLAAGLKVAKVDGWENRGRAEMGQVLGVMCHHTAGPRAGNMPSLNTLINGRSDLPGPLSQIGVGRDGTYYVIAAGRCNHAGVGSWQGITQGNSHFIGIEAENTGLANDQPWPTIQMRALEVGIAALLRHQGLRADACAGHKEYALPAGRKPDPSFDMVAFRAAVATHLMSPEIADVPIPAVEPATTEAPIGRATQRRGSSGDLVQLIQQKIGASGSDGMFDARTEAEVRQFQRQHDLVSDGIVGPKTWAVIDSLDT